MKTKYLQQSMTAVLLLSMGALLIGCGSSKVSSGEAIVASTSTPTTDTTTTIQGKTYGLANCSKSMSDSGFQVQLTGMSTQMMRLQILSLPADFKTTGVTIRVHKASVASDGSKNEDATQLPFRFEIRNSSGLIEPLASQYTYRSFDYSMMEKMMDYAKCNSDLLTKKYFEDVSYECTVAGFNNYYGATNPTDRFFKSVNFLVDTQDATNSFQILKVALESADGRTTYATTEILIPRFIADPQAYKNTHPDALFQLHPLKDKLGQTWTDAQLVSLSSPFCLY